MTEDQTTFYMVKLSCKGQIRSWQDQCEIPETEAEVLKVIGELHDCFTVERIIRCDYDVPPRDVTEDIRTSAFATWIENNDPDQSEPPEFIRELVEAEHGSAPDPDYSRDVRLANAYAA